MGMFDEVLENVGEPYKGGGKGFPYGTHKVKILLAEPQQKKTKNDPKAEVIVVSVATAEDPDNVGEATLYFHTEGGARMSVTKVLGLLVHKSGEEKKDQVRALGRKLFEQIDDPTVARDVAAKLINEKLIDQEAFFFVDPQGKYNTSSYGDVWHYEYEDPNADDRAEAAAKGDDPLAGAKPLSEEESKDVPNFDDL